MDNELEAVLRSRRPEVSLASLVTLGEAVSPTACSTRCACMKVLVAGCGGSRMMVPSVPAGLAKAACLGPAGHRCLPGSHQGRKHLPDAQPGHHSHPHCPRCAGDS